MRRLIDNNGNAVNRRDFLKVSARFLAGMALSSVSFAKVPSSRTEGNRIQRQLRLIMTLTNPKPYELVDQYVWLYMPAAETPAQKLESIEVSVPYERQTDPLGHSIIKFAFPRLAPLSAKVVSFIANVSMGTAPKMAPLENPQPWLKSERYIESADSGIQSLAAKLKHPEPRDTARAIYDWVRQHLHYMGYLADDRGAAYALDQRQGDCTEYAYLAVALARANGIPARMVGGYVVDKNAILRATDYHNWTEVYFDGTWRLLDAQKGQWLSPAEDYVAFRFYRDEDINPIGLAHRYSQSGDLEIRF
jgi:transglutaminase-like putative cysteine protease